MRFYWLILACIFAAPSMVAQNAELKTLADEDQASRLGTKKVSRTDEDRIKRVLELLAKGAAQTPEDKFDAALVLDHTGLDFCDKRLVSKSADNYLLANDLARESFAAGYEEAGYLVAATMDRYLSFTEGHQKYGTNRVFNQKTGQEMLVPIDRDVPDSERAKYGVAPLAKLLSTYPEQSRQDIPAATEPWLDWSFLLGEWVAGEGGGVPEKASGGYFSLLPELDGRVLVRKNHSEYGEKGKPSVSHDDLMTIYQEGGATKALYNDNEGHVIHYGVSFSADKKQIRFLSEATAGQPQYRLTYENLGQDTVNVIFEITPPDKPGQFSKYVEGVVHRKH